MLAVMNRSLFDTLDDTGLAWNCIKPVIQQVRGKHPTVKLEIYEKLNVGQKALLMFWILYGHSKYGIACFFDEVDYLLATTDIWLELKSGINFFDNSMIPVLEEMEEVYRLLIAKSRQGDAKLYSEKINSDPELLKIVGRLDTVFHALAPVTIKRIGAYIRKNPGEFIEVTD